MENIKNAIQATLETVNGGEWKVYTETERDEEATEYIKNTLWAFKSEFLARMTELPEEVFTALQDKYELGNDAILKLVEATSDLDEFVIAATDADGYGHFLSPYDGEELEIQVDGDFYYAYRIN